MRIGPLLIERSLTLDGGGEALVTGNGQGSVVTVAAAGAVVRGLTVR